MFIKSKKVLFVMLILVFLAMSSFFPKEAFAGAGNIVEGETHYKLNLNVLFTYNASWVNLNKWKDAFQKASELLYNSTEGQMQIGTVNVYNGLQSFKTKVNADVLISLEYGGRANASLFGLNGTGRILLYQRDRNVLGETEALEDSYDQVWISNTPSGYDTFFNNVSEFPAFDNLVDKKTKLFSGKEVIWFDKDNANDDHFHWRYGDIGRWVKSGWSYNDFNTRTIVRYNNSWNYIFCPNMGAPNYERGFSNTQDIAVVLMAIKVKNVGKYVLYIAKKGLDGSTTYYPFYATQVVPITPVTLIPEYKGQVTIVHELGHYVFGLLDEYYGVRLIGGIPNFFDLKDDADCTGNADDPASLMAAGAGHNDHRTEWCTPAGNGWNTDHNNEVYIVVENGEEKTYLNVQEALLHQSCWETIVNVCQNKYGITIEMPEDEPSTVMPPGHEDMEWKIIGGPWQAVIAIDRSKSMLGEKIQLAEELAIGFVDYFNPGELLGVVSFTSFAPIGTGSLDIHPLITGLEAKEMISNGYAAGGSNLKSALIASLDKILGSEEQSDIKFIILLSNGAHNYYFGDPSDIIPDLQEHGVKVFTVGFGDDVNVELLQDIADETGGRYYFASAEEDFSEIYLSIQRETNVSDSIDSKIGVINYEPITESVFIDTFNEDATFMLEWQDGDLDLTLQRPDGTIVNPEVAETDPNIEYVEEDSREFYRIYEPMGGEWQAIIDAVDVTGEEPYELKVSGLSMEVLFNVFTDKDQYTYPESIMIQAEVSAMYNVANAEVTGTVERPDGSTVDITLYDDGLTSHGDEFEDDGVYSNYFSEYVGGGTYTFNMVVENTEGVQASGFWEIPPEGWEPEPISPFRREASISVLLLKAGSEIALNFPSNIQYSDMLSGKATLTTLSAHLENMEVEFNSMLPTETLITDENGEVYSTPYKIEEIPRVETYVVCANFYGDPYYLYSYGENYITIEKENATLTYIGDTSVEVGNNATLSYQVTQDDDGYPGDITYVGPVTFNVTTLEGFDETYTASVGSDGVATIDIDLPIGLYTVVASIASDYFTSSPSEETILNVYNLEG